MAPLELKVSESLRLKRIARAAIVKEDIRQLVVPIPRGQDPATFLVAFLDELIPAPPAMT
jgi:transcription-repair coupling factor (superfamily II helicase)